MHPVFGGPSEPKQADRDSQCTKDRRACIKTIYETEHVRHRGKEGKDDCEVKCDVKTQEGDNAFSKKHLGATKKGDEPDAE
jgi:hypothetical protein